jgi:hypothetical protein
MKRVTKKNVETLNILLNSGVVDVLIFFDNLIPQTEEFIDFFG